MAGTTPAEIGVIMIDWAPAVVMFSMAANLGGDVPVSRTRGGHQGCSLRSGLGLGAVFHLDEERVGIGLGDQPDDDLFAGCGRLGRRCRRRGGSRRRRGGRGCRGRSRWLNRGGRGARAGPQDTCDYQRQASPGSPNSNVRCSSRWTPLYVRRARQPDVLFPRDNQEGAYVTPPDIVRPRSRVCPAHTYVAT